MTHTTDAPPRQAALPAASDLLALANRPADTIAHPAWIEARETILVQLAAGPVMIVLLGPPGTGKTALLRDLVTTLGESGRSACLLAFGDGPLDVGPAEIVLVDEADRMSTPRLQELRSRRDLSIVLAAVPAAAEHFAPYPDATVVRLAPLPQEGARAFLAARLAQLGLPEACLTDAARMRLISHAHGVPRLLLALLGFALFVAAEEHADRVTDSHVQEAIEARGGGMEPSAAEPITEEAEPAPRSAPTTPADVGERADVDLGQFNEPEAEYEAADAIGQPPPPKRHRLIGPAPPAPRRNRVVVPAFAAVCLVAAMVLLTWNRQQVPEAAAHGPLAAAATLAAADGQAQVTSDPRPASDVPDLRSDGTQTDPGSSPDGAAPSEEQAATAAQSDTVPVATKPSEGNAPLPASDLPHRCSDGNWTWSTCPAAPNRVTWRRVRRCAVIIDNTCVGASYDYERVR